jgi:hypothetical protein
MLFVGDDWARDHHDVELVHEDGKKGLLAQDLSIEQRIPVFARYVIRDSLTTSQPKPAYRSARSASASRRSTEARRDGFGVSVFTASQRTHRRSHHLPRRYPGPQFGYSAWEHGNGGSEKGRTTEPGARQPASSVRSASRECSGRDTERRLRDNRSVRGQGANRQIFSAGGGDLQGARSLSVPIQPYQARVLIRRIRIGW